jgi:hypothetical protein
MVNNFSEQPNVLTSALKMEAAGYSENDGTYVQHFRCHNPEDHNLNFHRAEDLKSYILCVKTNLICVLV